jgi:hypothetical protein
MCHRRVHEGGVEITMYDALYVAHIGCNGVEPVPPVPVSAWAPDWLRSPNEQTATLPTPEIAGADEVPPFEPDALPAESPREAEVADVPPTLLDCCPDCGGPLTQSCFGVQACYTCRVTRWRWMGNWKTVRIPDRRTGLPEGYLDAARPRFNRLDMPDLPPWIQRTEAN